MSAIVGIYNLDSRPVESTDLKRMLESLAFRGPDGSSTWNHGQVGFGHCMLYTTPESLHEEQPLVLREGDLVITADARIDNREELISALGLCGRPHAEITDSQLILSAYEKWGGNCPQQLLGDFAFAIWDQRAEKLFCARDHAGVKPFYYFLSDGIFIFASEIKALFCLPHVPRRLNEVMVAFYLAMNLEEKSMTLYQQVSRLPAAHSLTVKRDELYIRAYWSLDPTRELRLSSDKEYADAFREVFTEAVRCRLRSVNPVGSMLSGGLDSSSIVCVARQVLAQERGEQLHTFSAIFPSVNDLDPRSDESRYLQAVVSAGEIDHHYVRADNLTSFSEQVLHQNEHIPVANMYMDWAVFREAYTNGVRTILSGTDGDSVVGYGYYSLADLVRSGRMKTLLQETNALARKQDGGRRKILWKYGIRPLAPESAIGLWRRIRRYDPPPWDQRSLIRPEFARRVCIAERIQRLEDNPPKPLSTDREVHWISIASGSWTYILGLLDNMAAGFPLEIRYPFFDRRLMEFCLALPADQKLKQGWNRYILRRAMEDILPSEVQWRSSKGSMATNFRFRLIEHEREYLEELILQNPGIIAEYVDVSALQSTYKRYASDPYLNNRPNNNDAFIVFWIAALALWMRRSSISDQLM